MKELITHNIRYWVIRMIMLISVLGVFFLAYFFYVSSVNIFGYSADNPLYSYSEQLRWWLHLIVYFTLFSFLSSLVFMVLSIYFIKKRDDSLKTVKEYELYFSERLIEYIYSDFLNKPQSKDSCANYFKTAINKKLAKEVFFKIIIKLQLLTSEDLSLKLTSLIIDAGLKDQFKYLLYSHNSSEQIIAVKIISYLKVNDESTKVAKYMNSLNSIIERFLKSDNFTLRIESTIALIRLSWIKNSKLVLSQKKHISRLGINSIVNTIEKTHKNAFDFTEMIKSPHPRIAATGVLLAKTYNKNEYKDLIKDSLKRKRVLLHEIAWDAFAFFANTEEDLAFMMESFKYETYQNKLSILNSFNNFNYNNNHGDFLDDVIENEELTMKIIAMKLLFEVDFNLIYSYRKSSDKKIVDAYNEITDLILV